MLPGLKRRSSPTGSSGHWWERTNLLDDIGDVVQQIVSPPGHSFRGPDAEAERRAVNRRG